MIAVVKIGSSSLTDSSGNIDQTPIAKLCGEVAAARAQGHEIVLVTSGAVAAGMPALGLTQRPTDIGTLQAIAAVGQPRLMERFCATLAGHGLVGAQILLTPYDFIHRTQYLHARQTLRRLLDLGTVPVVNENDTVADDEIRYGDNDRLAALVAHLVNADVLLLLTDTTGLYTADPRLDEQATLIEEIVEVDAALEAVAGGTGSDRGSGGMASKLAAAKIAAWSGVRAVIAGANITGVVEASLAGGPIVAGVGTVVRARPRRLSSRKLWIAFAQGAHGRLMVDDGARRALVESGRSLLPAGVRAVEGSFEVDDPVEVIGPDGRAFAKGLVRYASTTLAGLAGLKTSALPEGAPHEVIHRDDLVMLP